MQDLNLIRVALIDRQRLLLDSLAKLIGDEPGIHVVAAAFDTDTGQRLVLETRPDVVLLDVLLPGRGAFDVAEDLNNRRLETKIVFLADYVSDVFINQALRLKAGGYFLKTDPLSTLVHGIKEVAAGRSFFSPDVIERMQLDESRTKYVAKAESQLASLTIRQLEVLRLLAKGHSVKEVAKVMHLSEKSIDSHKYRIMHKLGIRDRVVLARFAIREGLTLP